MSDTNDMRSEFEVWVNNYALREEPNYSGETETDCFAAWNAATERATAWQDVKDAERYRWLRKQEWFNGSLCVLRNPKKVLTMGLALGADCPSGARLDTAIDEAIRQGSDT